MEDRKEYYNFLEELRKSGVTNMWGAAPFLQAEFDISDTEAREILLDWIKNYSELAKEYGWRDEVEEVTGDEIDTDSRAKELFDGEVDRQEAEEVLQSFDDEPEYLEDAEHIWIVEDAPLVIKYKDGKVKFFENNDGHIEKYDDLIEWCDTYGYEYEDVSQRIFDATDLDKGSELNFEDEDKEFIDIDEVEPEEEETETDDTDESLKESLEYEYRDDAMISLGQVGVMHDITGEYIIFKDDRSHESNKSSLGGLTRTDIKYIAQACKEILSKESK